MNIFEKSRFEIWNQSQHPYKHTLGDFGYTNPSLPTVTTLEGAMNWIFAVLYPNALSSVATPADLPTGIDTPNIGDAIPTINDYRVVLDDGDGKASSYRWEQREGEVSASWHKIYDMDWGEQNILSGFLTKTQGLYTSKAGYDDIDENGVPLTGIDAGQYMYGGASANSHLTFYANSGDGTGPNTGFIQFGDQVRPYSNNAIDLGTLLAKFKDGYFAGNLLAGNLTLSGASFTSDTGQISFNDDNLVTTGFMESALLNLNGRAVMQHIATPANPAASYSALYFKADGKLYRLDSAGNEELVGLNFSSTNDNRLIRSDGTGGDAIQESGIIVNDSDEMTGITALTVDNLKLDGTTVSVDGVANTDLSLLPSGTGAVLAPRFKLSTFTQDAVYTPDATGLLSARPVTINSLGQVAGVTLFDVDNIRMDGNTISATDVNGSLNLSGNGAGAVTFAGSFLPVSDNLPIGAVANRISNLFISGSFNDGTNSIAIATLLSFRDALVGANTGDALFYNSVTGKFEASNPDSEIEHSGLNNLGLDDHAQYMLLAGRASGQSLIGGVAASEDLVFESTSHGTKGFIKVKDALTPFSNASYSGGWSGIDLGQGSLKYRDVYTSGVFFGLRFQNVTTAGTPAASVQNIGRMFYNTDDENIYVDTGSEVKKAGGSNTHKEDLVFNGTETLKNVDVSANIDDARNCIVQLLNNSNDFDRVYCSLKATSVSNIRIETGVPLVAGSYRLLVTEIG